MMGLTEWDKFVKQGCKGFNYGWGIKKDNICVSSIVKILQIAIQGGRFLIRTVTNGNFFLRSVYNTDTVVVNSEMSIHE